MIEDSLKGEQNTLDIIDLLIARYYLVHLSLTTVDKVSI